MDPPPYSTFLYAPPQLFSTYPILEHVLYSAVICTLSGSMNVLCNRPIPAHPPTHPASHPTTLPATPHPTLPRPAPTSQQGPHCTPSHPPPWPTRPATPLGPTRPASISSWRHRCMVGASGVSSDDRCVRAASALRGSSVIVAATLRGRRVTAAWEGLGERHYAAWEEAWEGRGRGCIAA